MMLAGITQLGGIVGGVGQALAISYPITGDYAAAIRMPSSSELDQYLKWDDALLSEWDLQIMQSVEGEDSVYVPFRESLSGLGPDEVLAFRTELAEEARARITELEETQLSTAASLQTAIARLNDAKSKAEGAERSEFGNAIQSLEDARTQLRKVLRDVNSATFQAAVAAAEKTETRIIPQDEQERIQRGHAILSSRLAELDSVIPQATAVIIAKTLEKQAVQAEANARAELDATNAETGTHGQVLIDGSHSATARKILRFPQEHIGIRKAEVEFRKNVLNTLVEPPTRDDKYWAGAVSLLTVVLLYFGRYGLIQNFSTVLVVLFTFITIGNVVELQRTPQWQVSLDDFLRGLSFGLPEGSGLTTALATFGIIGVGATELITYPYWCIEKGYAKYAGPRTQEQRWADRAKGWMRVMRYDAFLSMGIYTFATLAFFVMGVAVLYNEGRDPDGMRMVSTLATAYVPVFGEHAKWLFLIGAIAVLYSTFLVANAGHTRTYTDALKLLGIVKKHDEKAHDRSVMIFGVVLPIVSFATYWSGINPVTAVLLAGLMQAIMLPMLGFAALYFRWTATDPRLAPTKAWDVMLVLSCLGLLIAGLWGVASKLL
ncbi:MAG: hypothetical protein DWQ29_11260 [Planctomycetota bacterium]|nr:MAG: hypothetical protein DWQ29_11260 [Planctomycetota bacterium]